MQSGSTQFFPNFARDEDDNFPLLELLELLLCVVSLEIRLFDGKCVIFSPEGSFDPMLDAVVEEYLRGGNAGGDLGLKSMLCTLKLGLGDLEWLLWTSTLCPMLERSNIARFRDINGDILRFPFSAEGVRERQASVACVRYV